MLLYLVRHPQPEIASGICYGRTDLALRAGACEQAVAALRGSWPQGTPVFSSPLQRCRDLALRLHPVPVFDARLMELDFGAWEMQSWDDIPRHEIDAWAADSVHYRPGGGENVLAFAQRIAALVDDLHRLDLPAAVIVGHGGSLRLLQAWQAGILPVRLAQKVYNSPQHFAFGACIKLQLTI